MFLVLKLFEFCESEYTGIENRNNILGAFSKIYGVNIWKKDGKAYVKGIFMLPFTFSSAVVNDAKTLRNFY